MSDVLGEDVVHRRLVELDELAARQRVLMAELQERADRVAEAERTLADRRRTLEREFEEREEAVRGRERDADVLDRQAAELDDRALELDALERALEYRTASLARE